MTIASGISSNAPGTCASPRLIGVPRSTSRGWLDAAPLVVGQSRGGGPHGAGTSAGDPEAPTARREARGATPVGAGPVTHHGVQILRSASAGWRRQAPDPPCHGSGARTYAVASRPPVP